MAVKEKEGERERAPGTRTMKEGLITLKRVRPARIHVLREDSKSIPSLNFMDPTPIERNYLYIVVCELIL